jgi:hypothetical protein
MRTRFLGSAAALLFSATVAYAQAPQTGRVTPEFPKSGSPAEQASPGATGPGSEKNATTSPTSPDLPVSKQPPPDISPNSGTGAGASGTADPQGSGGNQSK